LDFRLYAHVIYRHKVLVICGLVLALLLAELSVVSISTNGTIRYRHSQLWASTTRMLVGHVYVNPNVPDPSLRASRYAYLATTDPVRKLMLEDGPLNGKVIANPVIDSTSTPQPYVDITGIATSAAGAYTLANRAARALQTYINQSQLAIAQSDRVPVRPIQRNDPVVFQPRSKTLPILIFVAVAFAFVGLAFLLENVKRRGQGIPDEPDREDSGEHIEARPVGVESQAASRRRSA
jgi:hypothetical protein